MPKALIIVNPISGGFDKKVLIRKAISRLEEMGYTAHAEFTRAAGHAATLAFEAIARHYNAVIVAGGDGTVNEVASALRNSGMPLGIIPCGSGNGLARHIGIPNDVDKALDIIAHHNVRPCDCGIANGFPFFCTFGMGFDAAVSASFAHSKKRGPISYVKSAVSELRSFRPSSYRLTINGHTLEFKAFLLTVANASQYGNNAFIAPGASIRDGLLDITVFHDGNPIALAAAGLDLFTGHLDHNLIVQTFRVSATTIETTSEIAHLDGDPTTMTSPVNIHCEPAALQLFLLPHKRRFKPFLTPLEYFFRDMGLAITRPFRSQK